MFVKMLIKYFIYSAIAAICLFGHKQCIHGYTFQTEYFNRSTLPSLFEGPYYRMWLDYNNVTEGIQTIYECIEFEKLCAAASEKATLEPDEFKKDRPPSCGFFFNQQYPREPLVRCNTFPASYLRLSKSGDGTIFIMAEVKIYQFHTEHYQHFNLAKPFKGPVDEIWLEQNNITDGLQTLEHREVKRLCVDASKYAALDLVEGVQHDPVAYQYFLSPLFSRSPLVKCGTIPVSYLRLGESRNDTVIIMTESNKYADVKFKAEVVMQPDYEPQPSSRKEYSQSQESEMKRLSRFASVDLLNVCVAAKKYLFAKEAEIPGCVPTLQAGYVEPVKMFNVKDNSSGIHYIAAIKCPTSPRMYVYYGSTWSNVDMRILLVHEAKKEKIRTTEEMIKLIARSREEGKNTTDSGIKLIARSREEGKNTTDSGGHA